MLTNIRNTRIEWCDCDPAGIIFYPRYFEIFDTSTTVLIEHALGMNKIDYLKAYDFAGHPLVEARARFRLPTRFGDEVAIETALIECGRSSFKIEHRLSKAGALDGRRFRDARVGDAAPRRPETHKVAADPARGACAFQTQWRLSLKACRRGPRLC